MPFMPLTNQLLGENGVTFTRGYVSTPLCCPSRASILTGQFAHNHGVIGNRPPYGGAAMFDDTSTLATWLDQAGYHTALVGKYLNYYHLIPDTIPPGWDQWFAISSGPTRYSDYFNFTLNENGVQTDYTGTSSQTYSTNVLRDKAVAIIQSTPAGQPLFLYFSTNAPHGDNIPDPADNGKFTDLEPYRPPSYNEADVSDKPAWLRERPLYTPSELQAFDEYYRLLALALQPVDRAVQAIVQALQDTGRLSNSVIVFTTDNGYALADHRLTQKNCVYESCSKVPFLVRAPGISPRLDDHLVQNIDIPATFADFAGITPPDRVDGLSLVDLLEDPGSPWRDEILVEVHNHPYSEKRNFQALYTSQYTYVEYVTGDRELYDLTVDPDQLENQIGNTDLTGVIEQFSDRLKEYKGETDLHLSVTASGNIIGPGIPLTMTFTIVNNGSLVAVPVSLAFSLPPGMQVTSCQTSMDGFCQSGNLGANFPVIRPGQSVQVQIDGAADFALRGEIGAEVSAFSPLESDPANNQTSIILNPVQVFLPIIN